MEHPKKEESTTDLDKKSIESSSAPGSLSDLTDLPTPRVPESEPIKPTSPTQLRVVPEVEVLTPTSGSGSGLTDVLTSVRSESASTESILVGSTTSPNPHSTPLTSSTIPTIDDSDDEEDSEIEKLTAESDLIAKASELEKRADSLYQQELKLMGKLLNTFDQDLDKICDFYALYLNVLKNLKSPYRDYFEKHRTLVGNWLKTLQYSFVFYHQELQPERNSETNTQKKKRTKLLEEALWLEESVMRILNPKSKLDEENEAKEEKDEEKDEKVKEVGIRYSRKYILDKKRALSRLQKHFSAQKISTTTSLDEDWERLGENWRDWGNKIIKIAGKIKNAELATQLLYLVQVHLIQPPQIKEVKPLLDVKVARVAYLCKVIKQQTKLRSDLSQPLHKEKTLDDNKDVDIKQVKTESSPVEEVAPEKKKPKQKETESSPAEEVVSEEQKLKQKETESSLAEESVSEEKKLKQVEAESSPAEEVVSEKKVPEKKRKKDIKVLALEDPRSLFMQLADFKANGLKKKNKNFYNENNPDFKVKIQRVYDLVNAETDAREAKLKVKKQNKVTVSLVVDSDQTIDCVQKTLKFLDKEIAQVELDLFSKRAEALRPKSLGGKPQPNLQKIADYLQELQQARAGFDKLCSRGEGSISALKKELTANDAMIKQLRAELAAGEEAGREVKMRQKQLKKLKTKDPRPKNFDKVEAKLFKSLEKAQKKHNRGQEITSNRELTIARARQNLLTQRLGLMERGNQVLYHALVLAMNEAHGKGIEESTSSAARSLITALPRIETVDARTRVENEELRDLLNHLDTAKKNWEESVANRAERQKNTDADHLSDFKLRSPSEVGLPKESMIDQLLPRVSSSAQIYVEPGLELANVAEQNAQITYKLLADEVLSRVQHSHDKKQKQPFAGLEQQRRSDIAELELQREKLVKDFKSIQEQEYDLQQAEVKFSELNQEYSQHKTEMEKKAKQLLEQVQAFYGQPDSTLQVPNTLEEVLKLMSDDASSMSTDHPSIFPSSLRKLRSEYEALAKKVATEERQISSTEEEKTRKKQYLSSTVIDSQNYVREKALPQNAIMGVRAFNSALLPPPPQPKRKSKISPESLPLSRSVIPASTADTASALLTTPATEIKQRKTFNFQGPLSHALAENLVKAIDSAEKSEVLPKEINCANPDWDSEWKQRHATSFSDDLTDTGSLDELRLFLQVKHSALADRDSYELQVSGLGAVRVFPPKKSMNIRFERDDILDQGMEYTRAALEILKYAPQHFERQNLAFIKQKLQLFHDTIHLRSMSNPDDRKIMKQALRQLGGALTAVLRANKLCKDHEQAKSAIQAMWKMELLKYTGKVAFCVLIPQPADSKEMTADKAGFRVEFYKQVRVGVPNIPGGVKDPWDNYEKSQWYKDAVKKIGPWFARYASENLETLRTTPTDAALRFLPNPATALDNTAFTVNGEKQIVSALSRDMVSAFPEPYKIEDEKERNEINKSNYLAMVIGEQGNRLKAYLRTFFENRQLPLLQDRRGHLIVPVTHHTLVGAPKSDSGKSFKKSASKKAANQAFKDFLKMNIPWLLSDGNVEFYAPGVKPEDDKAQCIDVRVKEVNDHVNMWGDIKGYGKNSAEVADTRDLLNMAADLLKKFEMQVPKEIQSSLQTITDFLKGDAKPVIRNKNNSNVGDALQKLTAYLCSAANELRRPDDVVMNKSAKRELAILTQAAAELATVHLGRDWAIYKHPKGHKPRKKTHEAVATAMLAKRLGVTVGGCMSSADRKQEIKALEVLNELLFDLTHSVLTYNGPLTLKQALEKCGNHCPTQLKHTLLGFFLGTPISKDDETRKNIPPAGKPHVLSEQESDLEKILSKEFKFTRKFSADESVVFSLELTDSKQQTQEKTILTAETELMDIPGKPNEKKSDKQPSEVDLGREQKIKQRAPQEPLQFLKDTLSEINSCHKKYLKDEKAEKVSGDNRIDIGKDSTKKLLKVSRLAIKEVAKLTRPQKRGTMALDATLGDKNYIVALTKIAGVLDAYRQELNRNDLALSQEQIMPVTVLEGLAKKLNQSVKSAYSDLEKLGATLSKQQETLLEKLAELEDDLSCLKGGLVVHPVLQTESGYLNFQTKIDEPIILDIPEENFEDSAQLSTPNLTKPPIEPPPPPPELPSSQQAITALTNVLNSIAVFNGHSYAGDTYKAEAKLRDEISKLEELQRTGKLEDGHFSSTVYFLALQAADKFLTLKLQSAGTENQEEFRINLLTNLSPAVPTMIAHLREPLLLLTKQQSSLLNSLETTFNGLRKSVAQLSGEEKLYEKKSGSNSSEPISTLHVRSIASLDSQLLTPPPPPSDEENEPASFSASTTTVMSSSSSPLSFTNFSQPSDSKISEFALASAMLSSLKGRDIDDEKTTPDKTPVPNESNTNEEIFDLQAAEISVAGQSSAYSMGSESFRELQSVTVATVLTTQEIRQAQLNSGDQSQLIGGSSASFETDLSKAIQASFDSQKEEIATPNQISTSSSGIPPVSQASGAQAQSSSWDSFDTFFPLEAKAQPTQILTSSSMPSSPSAIPFLSQTSSSTKVQPSSSSLASFDTLFPPKANPTQIQTSSSMLSSPSGIPSSSSQSSPQAQLTSSSSGLAYSQSFPSARPSVSSNPRNSISFKTSDSVIQVQPSFVDDFEKKKSQPFFSSWLSAVKNKIMGPPTGVKERLLDEKERTPYGSSKGDEELENPVGRQKKTPKKKPPKKSVVLDSEMDDILAGLWKQDPEKKPQERPTVVKSIKNIFGWFLPDKPPTPGSSIGHSSQDSLARLEKGVDDELERQEAEEEKKRKHANDNLSVKSDEELSIGDSNDAEELPGFDLEDVLDPVNHRNQREHDLKQPLLVNVEQVAPEEEEDDDGLNFVWPPAAKAETDWSYLHYLVALAASFLGVGYPAVRSGWQNSYVPVLQILADHPQSASGVGAFLYSWVFSRDRTPPPIVELFLQLADARFILAKEGDLTEKDKKFLRAFAKLMLDVINPYSGTGARFRWEQLTGASREQIGATLQAIISKQDITSERRKRLIDLIDDLKENEFYLDVPAPRPSWVTKISPLFRNVATFTLDSAISLLAATYTGNIFGWNTAILNTAEEDTDWQKSLNNLLAGLIWIIPPLVGMASLRLQRLLAEPPDNFTDYKHMARSRDHDRDRALHPGSKQAIDDDKKPGQMNRLNSRFQRPEWQGAGSWGDWLRRTFAFPLGTLACLPHDLQVRWIVDATVALEGAALFFSRPENIDILQVELTILGYFAPRVIQDAIGIVRAWYHSDEPGPRSSAESKRKRISPEPVELNDLNPQPQGAQQVGGDGVLQQLPDIADPEPPEAKLIVQGTGSAPAILSSSSSSSSTGQLITKLSPQGDPLPPPPPKSPSKIPGTESSNISSSSLAIPPARSFFAHPSAAALTDGVAQSSSSSRPNPLVEDDKENSLNSGKEF